MRKYTREIVQILSLSLLIFIFPHLVLASSGSISNIIDKKIATMTLEEKVGQLFLIGFPQTQVTTDLEKFIGDYKPGSFLMFKRNIISAKQILKLNTALYKASYKYTRLPPLIAIDQEGGSVSRLPIIPAPPNALALGQTQSPLLAEEMGHQMGLFLREVGFNMNLAPVLDVTDPWSGSFIGVRSFGSDPNLVADLGVAYSKGLLKARVIPTAKHFPGAGNIKSDPHLNIVQNLSDLQTLKEKDLKPYESYVKLGDKIALMLSHFIYPALDESKEPASFSKKISFTLLREEMKYEGLVVTDDLQMQGSKQLLRPEVAALRALQSGADVVMLTWSFADQGRAFEYVRKNIVNGNLDIQDVDKKLHRILTAKAFVNLYHRNPLQPSLLNGLSLTSKDYSEIETNILEKNLKANLTNKSDLNRQKFATVSSRNMASTMKICVLSPSRVFINSFKRSLNKNVVTNVFKKDYTKEEMKTWIAQSGCSVSLIAVTGPKTAAMVRALSPSNKIKSVIVNLGAPKFFPRSNGYLRVLQLYFNHTQAGTKVAQHLNEILDTSVKSYTIRF